MGESRALFTLIPLFVGAVGLFFSFLGVAWLRRERVFTREAIRAEGTVIGFERRRYVSERGLRRISYRDHPVISYTTREGHPSQFESPVGTLPRLQREGQRVPILYNPANLADGRIATGCMQFAAPLALIIFGLAVALFAAFFAASTWFIFGQLPPR